MDLRESNKIVSEAIKNLIDSVRRQHILIIVTNFLSDNRLHRRYFAVSSGNLVLGLFSKTYFSIKPNHSLIKAYDRYIQ